MKKLQIIVLLSLPVLFLAVFFTAPKSVSAAPTCGQGLSADAAERACQKAQEEYQQCVRDNAGKPADRIEEICNAQAEPEGPSSTTDTNPKVELSDCAPKDEPLSPGNCGILKYIRYAANFLSAAAGTIIVIMIIIGGIQYTSAGDNPQTVAAAKQKIRNAILALITFIFMMSFLEWLVPGGLF